MGYHQGTLPMNHVEDACRTYNWFDIYMNVDSVALISEEKRKELTKIIDLRFNNVINGYNHRIDLTRYHQEMFNPNCYIDVDTFMDIYQHMQNQEDIPITTYDLTGKLEGFEQLLDVRNFTGDTLTKAMKAKIYIELLIMDQECSNAQQGEGEGEEGEGEGQGQAKEGEGEDGEGQAMSDKASPAEGDPDGDMREYIVKQAHHEKRVFDNIQARDPNAPSLKDSEMKKVDLFEQKTIQEFAKDKGIITEKKIDISYESLFKMEQEKDLSGDMQIEKNKSYRLKGVSKTQMGNPLFKIKHAQKQLFRREYYKYVTKNERAVFILVDVSGSMSSYGKIAVRNGIFADRWDAVMKGRCRLFIEGYLDHRQDMLMEIKNAEDLAQWSQLRPTGGDTRVENAVRELMQTKEFKQFTKNGQQGEIILINDGQDRMPPFKAPDNIIIHAMQLADADEDEGSDERYKNTDLENIALKNGGKYVFFNTYKLER